MIPVIPWTFALTVILVQASRARLRWPRVAHTVIVPRHAIPFRPRSEENTMLLVREIMYCKPGKVRPMVDKFLAMSKLGEKMGMPKMKVMTDLSAERYWTIVSEMEVPSLQAFENMMSGQGQNAEDMKKFDEIMKGYHDLVEHGRREIYKLEG